jgi:RNA polymerase sigma-54 factor
MVALSAHLSMDARLQQTVSPQVILQSQILELTADDLRERIEAELHENPVLEMADDIHYLPAPAAQFGTAYDAVEAIERLRAPHRLADDLRLQLIQVPDERRAICEYLIECLDERGFVNADLADVAAQLRLPLTDVQEALAALQSLEPAGVGARDIRECLLIQLRRLPARRVPPHAADFITNFLGRPRASTPVQVAEAMGLSRQQLTAIVEFVGRNLHMWPADCFAEEGDGVGDSGAVLPDAAITWDEGELRVRVVQSWGRNLRVSEAWSRLDREMQQLEQAPGTQDERVAERIRRARTFIDCLNRREVMVKRITDVVVDCQREFFTHGRQALVPLTRKEIAGMLRVHESTVSRATSGKFVQLPNMQLVPYDFFFDASLSAKSVLQSLIEHEAPQQPLSDAALAERLQAAGYPLARRTVGKYRDQLGIPGMHLRRGAL